MPRKYRTIVADPPWPFTWQGGTGGRRRNKTSLGYPTMSYREIELFGEETDYFTQAEDATLFLWATQEALHGGKAEATAWMWGFPARVGEIVWRKPNFGTGACPRIGHETCVIYKRGKGSLRPDAPRNVHSVQEWRQDYSSNAGKKHSAKPDGLCDLIEAAYEGPYLEVFARRARLGWDYLGNESLETAEAAA